MPEIRIALIGIGNCASALVQGVARYRTLQDTTGLRHAVIGDYRPADIRVVAAFDVDARKVGRDVSEAIFAGPNCTSVFEPNIPATQTRVRMGPVLDGVTPFLLNQPESRSFRVSDAPAEDVAVALRESGAQVVVNYLPVGAQQATEHYAHAALEAGCALVNCIPVFIASDANWAARFAQRGLPLIGDDIKSQCGATIVHRSLVHLMEERGIAIDRMYQLNIGGNTDFLNMLQRERLESKRESKTQSVQSQLEQPLAGEDIHIGPSDYVPWLRDRKVCHIRIEGRGFGGAPVEMDLRLSVEDSPNSAGVVIDAIRCAKLALDRGVGGVIPAASAYCMKHPPQQMRDEEAARALESFIRGAADPSQPHSSG